VQWLVLPVHMYAMYFMALARSVYLESSEHQGTPLASSPFYVLPCSCEGLCSVCIICSGCMDNMSFGCYTTISTWGRVKTMDKTLSLMSLAMHPSSRFAVGVNCHGLLSLLPYEPQRYVYRPLARHVFGYCLASGSLKA
jgi:hypothetical protein